MFMRFQSCLLLKLSICGSLDLRGFHRVAFGPSPQQNHIGGRGDYLVNNFLKGMAYYPLLGINRSICISLTYPENFKKIYHAEKKLCHLYTKMWASVKIFLVSPTFHRGAKYEIISFN